MKTTSGPREYASRTPSSAQRTRRVRILPAALALLASVALLLLEVVVAAVRATKGQGPITLLERAVLPLPLLAAGAALFWSWRAGRAAQGPSGRAVFRRLAALGLALGSLAVAGVSLVLTATVLIEALTGVASREAAARTAKENQRKAHEVTLVSVSPPPGSRDVASITDISTKFDRSAEGPYAPKLVLTFSPEPGDKVGRDLVVEGQQGFSPDGRTLRFVPSMPLKNGVIYRAQLVHFNGKGNEDTERPARAGWSFVVSDDLPAAIPLRQDRLRLEHSNGSVRITGSDGTLPARKAESEAGWSISFEIERCGPPSQSAPAYPDESGRISSRVGGAGGCLATTSDVVIASVYDEAKIRVGALRLGLYRHPDGLGFTAAPGVAGACWLSNGALVETDRRTFSQPATVRMSALGTTLPAGQILEDAETTATFTLEITPAAQEPLIISVPAQGTSTDVEDTVVFVAAHVPVGSESGYSLVTVGGARTIDGFTFLTNHPKLRADAEFATCADARSQGRECSLDHAFLDLRLSGTIAYIAADRRRWGIAYTPTTNWVPQGWMFDEDYPRLLDSKAWCRMAKPPQGFKLRRIGSVLPLRYGAASRLVELDPSTGWRQTHALPRVFDPLAPR